MKRLPCLQLSPWLARLLILLLLPCLPAHAQGPVWQTAFTTPGTNVVVQATAFDANGNLVVVGNFTNTATFGATTLTSTGTGTDGFVAKWSPSTSRFVWVQQISGSGGEYVTSVALNGNRLYIGGVFTGSTATIGTTFLGNANSMGNNDLFVARLTDTGSSSAFDWAQRAGGQPSENLTGLAVSGTSLYAVGTFSGSGTTFGPISLSNLAPSGLANIFITKMTDTGSTVAFDWAQQAGGSAGGNSAEGVAVSGNSVYLTGHYSGADVRFGAVALPPASNIDWFVAKLTDAGSAGNFVWAQATGGAKGDFASTIAVSGPSIYCAGYFDSPTMTIGGTLLSNMGAGDAFVAKLTDAGSTASFAWAQAAGGTGFDKINSLAVRNNSVYATGLSSSPTLNFGSSSLSTVGGNDAFVAKLTDAGSTSTFTWAQQAGGTGYDGGAALAVQGNQIYVAGIFNSPVITFNPTLALGRPGAGFALFLASLTDATLTATSSSVLSGPAFTVFPNPARAYASITLPAMPGITTINLTLLDALGRTLRNVALPTASTRYEFPLDGLPVGVYTVWVRAKKFTAAHRLVIE